MIPTNQVKISFDYAAIARDFILFEVRRDQGDYKQSVVPDVASQQCHALAVVYDWGPSCYLLYKRDAAEQHALKQTLECFDDTLRIQEIQPDKLADKQKYLLTQLLCNAIPGLEVNATYHNVTGRLYYLHNAWCHRREDIIDKFWALQISFNRYACIKLEVKTFRNVCMRPAAKDQAQYVFDPDCGVLRRALKGDDETSKDRFVIGALYANERNTIPYLAFDSIKNYRASKMGVLQRFLRDVQTWLAPYLTLEIMSLDESTHIGMKSSKNSMLGIRQRLREVPLYLEDTVQDAQSEALVSMLRAELKKYSDITFAEGTLRTGNALIRIIHHAQFYEKCPEQDNYAQAPKDCIVQHITVEDFGTKDKKKAKGSAENAALRKIIQELAIKIDVHQRQIACYDWTKLAFSAPVTFVTATRDHKDKAKPICYNLLRVQPDGVLQFEHWEQSLFWDGPEKEKIAAAFETRNGKFDLSVQGLVYEDIDNIHIIRTTDRYTLPNMQGLAEKLRITQDEESIAVDSVVEAIQAYADTLSGDQQEQCTQILKVISQYGKQIRRKELKKIVNLRSKIGRQINAFVFEKTGVLIGPRLKCASNRERLFGGVLGIRHFCEGNVQYYYSGYVGASLQKSLAHACRIRMVCSTGDKLQFERYLPLLEVDFVRTSGWTVIPFPFKYLREWNALQK